MENKLSIEERNKKINALKIELLSAKVKLNRLIGIDANSYTNQVSRSFPLGMVGGSGKNIHGLNKRRESELNKNISNAKIHIQLEKDINRFEKEIEYYETFQDVKNLEKKQNRAQLLANWFKNLKPGDTFKPGGNVLIISKVSRKSLITDGDCKWTATEVIGKEAAKLL